MQKTSIDKYLLELGLITEPQLVRAQEESKKQNVPLEEALINLGFITEEDFANFLSDKTGIPYIDLTNYLIDPVVIGIIPEELARKHLIIPLFKIRDTLTVGMINPQDVFALDEVRTKTSLLIEPAIVTREALKNAQDQYYGVKGTFDEVAKDMGKGKVASQDKETDLELERLARITGEAPVIKLVNLMMFDAIRARASDIHIEPEEKDMMVRFRIDGVLKEVKSPPRHLYAPIVSRIKVMSDLNISERRVPQDGRFQIKFENRLIDVRVSTVPTINGENVVLRLLDRQSLFLGLPEIGFSDNMLSGYNELIRRPHGIILVCGPTGSGKTTTLYASLSSINSPEKNIITIEDPVEYKLPLIRQSQINPKAGIDFANGLRSILRQDPDIIMVGEIRDLPTAEIAIQAALTGHLVFSTLHTNDAPSAITRLIDMGVEPFLISSSLIGVISQRLIRLVCPKCKEEYVVSGSTYSRLGINEDIKLARGKGCGNCLGTGYKGRIGIFELMLPDERIRNLTINKAPLEDLRKAAISSGMTTLREDGIDKAKKHLTSIEEIMRVTVADVDI